MVRYVILVILDRALFIQSITLQRELTMLDKTKVGLSGATEVIGVIVLGVILGAMFAYGLLGGFQ